MAAASAPDLYLIIHLLNALKTPRNPLGTGAELLIINASSEHNLPVLCLGVDMRKSLSVVFES